jgi:hypothetical protein
MGWTPSDLEIENIDSPLVAVWKFEEILRPGNFSEKISRPEFTKGARGETPGVSRILS